MLILCFWRRLSPVPELSFLPTSYRGWTRGSERRVQDNLHAHAQNGAIFSPKSREKPYLEILSRFGLWRDFLNDNIQASISAFRLIKNVSIEPKSVEFHECHANPHSICFFIAISKITKEIFAKICWTWKHRFGLESARAALCKWLSFQKLLQNRSTYRNDTKKMFGKRVTTRTCRQEYRAW